MSAYQVPLYIHLMRFVMRLFFRLLMTTLSPIKITGRNHIPSHGPYIVAINHVSLYEAPFILAFWPIPLEVLGAVEIWSKPGQNILASMYGGIQVHRGEYDRQVINKAMAVLESKRPLMLAPEGGRSHTPGMRQAHIGVAYLADKAAVPVIPVGIVGTTEDYAKKAFSFKRPPLEMHIGKPIHLPVVNAKGIERRQVLQDNTTLLMRQLASLLPEEYRGVYDAEDDKNGKS